MSSTPKSHVQLMAAPLHSISTQYPSCYVCRTSWQLFCCARRHSNADRGTFDIEGHHRWEAAQKTTHSVRTSFQAGFNFHAQDAPQGIFHFIVYISKGQMCPLKAISDFNIGTQDRVAQAKHPHFFSETELYQITCVQTSQQTRVLFFIWVCKKSAI